MRSSMSRMPLKYSASRSLTLRSSGYILRACMSLTRNATLLPILTRPDKFLQATEAASALQTAQMALTRDESMHKPSLLRMKVVPTESLGN